MQEERKRNKNWKESRRMQEEWKCNKKWKENRRMKEEQKRNKKWTKVARQYPVFEYTFAMAHDADTFRARSKALNKVRSAVYDPQLVDHGEYLLCQPDNPIIAAEPAKHYAPGDMPLGAFRVPTRD